MHFYLLEEDSQLRRVDIIIIKKWISHFVTVIWLIACKQLNYVCGVDKLTSPICVIWKTSTFRVPSSRETKDCLSGTLTGKSHGEENRREETFHQLLSLATLRQQARETTNWLNKNRLEIFHVYVLLYFLILCYSLQFYVSVFSEILLLIFFSYLYLSYLILSFLYFSVLIFFSFLYFTFHFCLFIM